MSFAILTERPSAWFGKKCKRVPAGDSRPLFLACTGMLVVQQTGSSFTGSFAQGHTCAPTSGLVTAGVVRADGTEGAWPRSASRPVWSCGG